MKKDVLTQEEQAQQIEGLKSCPLFHGPNLDVYGFSYWLYDCLSRDGYENIHPNEIMDLLLELAVPCATEQGHMFEAPILDMNEEKRWFYPEGKTILLHIAPITIFIHDFIFEIGNRCLKVTCDVEAPYFAYWLKREDIFTFTYLHTFFAQLRSLMKQVTSLREMLMELHLSKNFDVEFGSLSASLKEKDELHKYANNRFGRAIEQEFYLEAITLAESIISDRLSMVLYLRGEKAKSKTLNKLVELSSTILPDTLSKRIDEWRQLRNFAVHNLVRSSPIDKQISPSEFNVKAKDIAVSGKKLVSDLEVWFDDFVSDEMNPFNIRISGKLN
jgi:hypothetical protein